MASNSRIFLLIGHRGVGKTSLLKRIKQYYKEESKKVQCIDLDWEIQNRQGRSAGDIFNSEGEEFFRELEKFQLQEILNTFSSYQEDVYLALGAGLDLEQSALKNCRYIWVRRETDKLGRVFLNRPRLNFNVKPLAEYLERYNAREKIYSSFAHQTLTLQEGAEEPNVFEKEFFFPSAELKATVTLLPENFRSLEGFVSPRAKWDCEFELRDDLLDNSQLKTALELKMRRLLSFRESPPNQTMLMAVVKDTRVDWPVDLAASTKLNPTFSSIHSDGFSKVRRQLTNAAPLKLAVKINSWAELLEGHKWWTDKKSERAFLPMSDDGRWDWYRLWVGSAALVNFVREGAGSAADQPKVLDWFSTRANDPDFRKNGFAAVLGDPVVQSRTPVEQQNFFAQFKMPVFAIRVTQQEFTEALKVLRELGLKSAAITSPLKELAFQTCNETSDLARSLESVNTLLFKNGKWIGENTDLGGFQKLSVNRKDSAVIWGGGGTLEMTRLMVPNAYLYSAQTGDVREGAKPFPPSGSPHTLLWSVGRTHYASDASSPSGRWPPEHWRPAKVVDLNYTEDSPGLEYAALTGAEYVSGLAMFKEQARLQREFWSQHLNPLR